MILSNLKKKPWRLRIKEKCMINNKLFKIFFVFIFKGLKLILKSLLIQLKKLKDIIIKVYLDNKAINFFNLLKSLLI